MHNNTYHRLQKILINNTEFKHAGVKGMKWGIRKSKFDKLSKKVAQTEKMKKQQTNMRKTRNAHKKGTISDLELRHLALKIDRKRPLDLTTVSKRALLAKTTLPGVLGITAASAGAAVSAPLAVTAGLLWGGTELVKQANNENARQYVYNALDDVVDNK